MKTKERRSEIVKLLYQSEDPIPAKTFAEMFQVSRQVIVQDIAVIRATVSGIVSTNRGYLIPKESVRTREFKVRHTNEQTERELNCIVDLGGKVLNVSISHRVYGRISAKLDIASRKDVAEFLGRLEDSKSSLLGNTTSGYHYHLVEASNEERLDAIEEALREAGFLAPLLSWEQENDVE